MAKKKASKKPPNPVGRPPLFKTAEELQTKIDEYFKMEHEWRLTATKDGGVQKIKVLTISGLVIYCGFCDRHAFYDYEKKPEFSHTIKKARARIEMHYEGLIQGTAPTGSIFALKNFGWKDRTEIDQTVNIVAMPTIKLVGGKELDLDIGEAIE